jgi:flagellar basal-body rod modification protein FlgD
MNPGIPAVSGHPVNAAQNPAPSASQPSGGESAAERLANKEIFLQLLVAQIRNQNPLSPANGTEFVAQLAQFSELEATLAMRRDVARILEVLDSKGGG